MTRTGGAGVIGAPMVERVCPGTFGGSNGERVALEDVELHATLHDLMCEVRQTQVYRNTEPEAIEAVYTFPLPLDAVLLDVHVTLGTRELEGVVVEKATAERRYEEAVAEGDGAVMLEQGEAGLYTMNVGNLLPREVARITVRYAMLLRWSGNRLRLHFPTTIAPRYGESRLMPHQEPVQSLLVENRFAFSLTVTGTLKDGQFACPSHALVQGRTEEALVLSLSASRAPMDRDVVIELRAPHANRDVLLSGADGDGTAAIASFQPFFGGLQQSPALSLVLVVDCSGSMGGDSMTQALHALRAIVSQLHPHDRLGIVAFGSHTKRLRDRLAPCTPAFLEHAVAFCTALDADMGGTEVAQALDEAHALLRSAGRGEVFLITDGQVAEWESVVARARATGHRHFTVGVGSAVSEAFVRRLAEETGGASELVSPNEGMTERIVRHFERMRAPRAKAARVIWPEGAQEAHPSTFGSVFQGDTLVSCARFDSRTSTGEVVLEVETEHGELFRRVLQLTATDAAGATHSTVARITAAHRLPALAPAEAQALAVRYQLASPYTNWLVIAERSAEEKAREMPALRKVPQTMAAGWGGMGGVRDNLAPRNMRMASPMAAMSQAAPIVDRARVSAKKFLGAMNTLSALVIPTPARAWIRDDAPPASPPPPPPPSPVAPTGGDGEAGPSPAVELSERVEALLNADPSRLEPTQVAAFVREVVDGAAGLGTFGRFVQLTATNGTSESEAATVLLAGLLRVLVLVNLTADAQLALDRFLQRSRSRQVTRARTKAVQAEVERVCWACIGKERMA